MNKINNGPIVSVIMPVFNSEKYIEKTLLSVLEQTYKNYEVIIIDDGSNDNSLGIIEGIKNRFNEKRIIILNQSHKGAGAARNLGIKNAKADLIAFLDSDDFWFPNKLERVIGVFNLITEINLVVHDLIINKNGHKKSLVLSNRYNPKIDYFVNLYKTNCLAISAVTVRRSILFEVGLFDEFLPPVEDYDLWLKLAPLAKPYYLREKLGYYLIREDNQTADIDLRLRQATNVLKRHYPELNKKIPFANFVLRKRRSQFLGAAGKDWLLRGNITRAALLFMLALIQWPFNIKIFLYLFWVLITKLNLDKILR